MANFNRIILIGKLTRDVEVRYLANQTAVASFGLAVNNKYKTKDGQDKEEVLFIDCTCFGRGGEIINQYCQKGKELMVEGRLRYETWDDKNGGGKRSKHSVTVDNFQLMGGNRDGGSRGDDDSQTPPPTRPSRQPSRGPSQRPPKNDAPTQQDDPEDIPFRTAANLFERNV